MLVGLHGYYGCGNIGDWAMGLCIVKRLRNMGHRVVLILFDAACGEEMLSYADAGAQLLEPVRRFEPLDALIIGGGEAGPGFGWQLAVPMLLRNKPVVHFGQSYTSEWSHPAAYEMLKWCTVIPRRECSLGKRAADPAFDMRCEPQERKGALLFVRYPSRQYTEADQFNAGLEAYRMLKGRFNEVYVGSCSRDDYRFASDLLKLQPMYFESPQRCLEAVAGAELCCTIGRYHPAVFACTAETPCIGTGHKLQGLEAELNFVYGTELDHAEQALSYRAQCLDAQCKWLDDGYRRLKDVLERNAASGHQQP